MTSEIIGLFQGDIIIRSALLEGIADLRRNPWLLQYVFASLKYDDLTSRVYGQKEIDQAAKWFMATEIPIFMSARVDKSKFPCVSISQVDSSETELTLADVHYKPSEDNDLQNPPLTAVFAPVSFVSSTGVMIVPDSVTANLILAPGMVIYDDTGRGHPILEVTDRSTFSISAGVTNSFSHAVIKGAAPSRIATLESVKERETYQIGCHVQGEPVHLTYLHSIIKFIIFRYRQDLFEARGFERSTSHSSDFSRNAFFDAELVFTRSITLTGTVTQVWPKLVSDKITGVVGVPIAVQVGDAADAPDPDIGVDSEDAWMTSVDSLLLRPPK